MSHGPTRRTFATLLGALSIPAATWAQSEPWPARPVKLVVPTPPGGATDRLARLLATELGKSVGQPFVVDNRGGAGGSLGTAVVAKAPADGYTLLFTGVFNTINPGLYPKLPYDYVDDFVHIAPMTQGPNVLVARPDFAASSVAELVALAKARPGALDYASGGNGTSGHLTMEMFVRMAGIRMNHLAYKGAAPALQDVLAGVVPMMPINQDTAIPHVKAGKLKVLAVTSRQRNPVYPDAPTFVESGFPELVVTSWAGLDAPKGTPAAIVERLNAASVKALQSKDLQGQLLAEGWVPYAATPAEFDAFVRAEAKRWLRTIQDAGIRIE